MLKIERKLIGWAEKHMLVLMLLLVSALALYIRRFPIWWNTEDVAAYFDAHENCTQSFFYFLLVRGVQVLPLLPVHSIKWLSIAGDFGTAALCLLLVREWNKENSLLQALCYCMCLFSPVLILRGCAWAQIDSLAVMFFLLGWLLWGRGAKLSAVFCIMLSALLYPCMAVFGCGLAAGFFDLCGGGQDKRGCVRDSGQDGERKAKQEERRNDEGGEGHNAQWLRLGSMGNGIYGTGAAWLWALAFLAVWLFLCGLTALPLGRSFLDGIRNSVAWTSFDPVSGQPFAAGLDWLLEMAVSFGLAGSVVGGLLLARRGKCSAFAVLGLHFLVTVLYGSRMF